MKTAILRNAKVFRTHKMGVTFRYGQPQAVTDEQAEQLAVLRTRLKGIPRYLFEISDAAPATADEADEGRAGAAPAQRTGAVDVRDGFGEIVEDDVPPVGVPRRRMEATGRSAV